MFFSKGIAAVGRWTSGGATITIQKLRPDYRDVCKWARTDEALKSVQSPILSDDERQVVAAKATKRKKKNESVKAANAVRRAGGGPGGGPGDSYANDYVGVGSSLDGLLMDRTAIGGGACMAQGHGGHHGGQGTVSGSARAACEGVVGHSCGNRAGNFGKPHCLGGHGGHLGHFSGGPGGSKESRGCRECRASTGVLREQPSHRQTNGERTLGRGLRPIWPRSWPRDLMYSNVFQCLGYRLIARLQEGVDQQNKFFQLLAEFKDTPLDPFACNMSGE